MSDTDPLKPSVSTSTVPLKKETVRISLRAQPDESGPIAPRGTGSPVPADATGPTTPLYSGDSGSLPTQPLQSGDSGSLPTQPLSASIFPPGATASILPPSAPTPLKASGAPAPPSAPRTPSPPPSAGGSTPPRPPSAGAPTPPPPPSAGGPTPPPPPAGIPLSKGPDPLASTRPVSTGPDPLGPTVPVVLPAATVATAATSATAAPPRPPGAPLAPPAGPPAASAPLGAKTIPLVKSPQGGGGPGPVGRVTTPLQPGGGTARPLPPATVKLDRAAPLGATSGRLAPRPGQIPLGEDDDTDADLHEATINAGLMPFAIIVLILSIAVLAIEALTKFGASS